MLALRNLQLLRILSAFLFVAAMGWGFAPRQAWSQDCRDPFRLNSFWEYSRPPEASDPRDPTPEERAFLDQTLADFKAFVQAAGLTYREGMRVQLYGKGQDHYRHLTREIALIVPKGAKIDKRILLHELSHGIFDGNYVSQTREMSIALSIRGGASLAPWQVAYDELFADACAFAASGLESSQVGRSFTTQQVEAKGWNSYKEHGLFGPVRSFLGSSQKGDHLLHPSPADQGRVLRKILDASAKQEAIHMKLLGEGNRLNLNRTPSEINLHFLNLLSAAP